MRVSSASEHRTLMALIIHCNYVLWFGSVIYIPSFFFSQTYQHTCTKFCEEDQPLGTELASGELDDDACF